jgi:predicted DNA-binding protein (MmcQ/YjbR family)
MARTFVITSHLYEGELHYTYNEAELLIGFKVEGEVDQQRLEHILQHLPTTRQNLESMVKLRQKKGTIKTYVELQENISFEKFWETYPRKIGKIETQRTFAKLKEHERKAALTFVAAYKKQADKDQVAYLYPATYLNKKRWEDG